MPPSSRRLPRIAASALAAGCCAFLASCGAPGPDAARGTAFFTAENGLRVGPLGDGSFEVYGGGSASGSRFFCAASAYAQTRLNAPYAGRVVLHSPIGPSVFNPGGRGATFRLGPPSPGASQSGFTLSLRRAGKSISVGHGLALCEVQEPGFFG